MPDDKLFLRSGDSSLNQQAKTINNYGLSCKEARELFFDLFENNFESTPKNIKSNIVK